MQEQIGNVSTKMKTQRKNQDERLNIKNTKRNEEGFLWACQQSGHKMKS